MLHEFLTSYDFERYRKKELKVMVDVIWAQLQQKPEQAAGAITLANRLLNLPANINPDQAVKAKQKEVLDNFKLSFVRIDED